MDKQMQDVRVRTGDGLVFIEQDSPELSDLSIVIHSEQIDLLIQWLGEARDEKAIADVLDE